MHDNRYVIFLIKKIAQHKVINLPSFQSSNNLQIQLILLKPEFNIVKGRLITPAEKRGPEPQYPGDRLQQNSQKNDRSGT